MRTETAQLFTNCLLLIVTACGVVVAHEYQRPYVRVLPKHATCVGDRGLAVHLEFEDIGGAMARSAQYSIDWRTDVYPITKQFDYREPDSAETELMSHSPVSTDIPIDLRDDAADVKANSKSPMCGARSGTVRFCVWPLVEHQRFCYALGGSDLSVAGDCSGVIPREQPKPEPHAQPIPNPLDRGPTGPPPP